MTEKNVIDAVNQISLDRFSLSDPTDRAGTALAAFSFYRLDELGLSAEKSNQVVHELYKRVYGSLKKLETIPGIDIKITDFVDYANKGDVRRYITAHRKTGRKASATMFVRFLRFDNQLYLSVDSYILGNINWIALCLKSIPLLLAIVNVLFFLSSLLPPNGPNGFSAFLFFVGTVFWGLVSVPLWLKIIMRFLKSKDLETTIRQEFSGKLDAGSFTEDDISSFLRTSLKLSLTSIRDVFAEEKIPFEEIERYVQNINNNYVNVTAGNNVNVAGGSAIGIGNISTSRN